MARKLHNPVILEQLEQRTLYSTAADLPATGDGASAADTGTINLGASLAAVYANLVQASPAPTPAPAPTPTPTPAPAPTPTPAPTPAPAVGLGMRYGNELVVTPATQGESFSVAQVGNTLVMTGNGQITTVAIPAAGFFIYTPGGGATVTLQSSITAAATVVTVGDAPDTIISYDASATFWIDSSDSFSGGGNLHRITAFYQPWTTNTASPQYVPLARNGPAITEPLDAGSLYRPAGSLWGTGPTGADVNQRSLNDCYYLATLESLADTSPARLEQLAVDLGDGTYAVQFDRGGVASYVRVAGVFSTQLAALGPGGSLWPLVFETAYAYFRAGANTFASINNGNTGAVAADLGIRTTSTYPAYDSNSTLYTLIKNDLSAGKVVMANTQAASTLISYHSYAITAISMDAAGNISVTLDNPWGSASPNDGIQTVSLAVLKADVSWIDYEI